MDVADGPRAKVERAGVHLAEFDAVLREFLARDPYEFTPETNPQTGKPQLRLAIKSGVPIGAGLIAGDVIHNLRSALDHLTWRLSLLKNPTPDQRVEFPIFHSQNNSALRKKINDVPRPAQEMIESMQPYHAGEQLWRFHPLYYIHRLDIIDKHRRLIVLAHSLNVELMTDTGVVKIHMAGPLYDGQVVDLPPPLGQPEVHTKIYPALAIPFEDADGTANELSLTPPQDHLTRIYNDVRDKFIPPFDQFFGD